MASVLTGTGDVHGPSRHAGVYRLPGGRGTDPGGAATAASALAGGPVRLWTEPVAGPVDGAVAAARRSVELNAPLGGAPARLVVLEYADGVRELVVTADPARVGRPAMDRIAASLGARGTGTPHAAPAPRDGLVAALPVPLPEPPSGPLRDGDVAAALALVLARTFGDLAPALEVLDPHGAITHRSVALPGEDDEDRPVAAHRAAAARPGTDPGGSAPGGGGLRVALLADRHRADPAPAAYRPPLDARHAVTVHLTTGDGGPPMATCWYRTGDLPGPRAATLVRQLSRVTAELLTGDQDAPLAGVDPLGPAERRRVLELGRTPRVPGPLREGTVHEQVLAVARARPEATALVDGDTTMTYGVLARQAVRTAHALRRLGVAPGDRVGVCLDRTADLVVTLLGVLTAGAAYVPLDPAYPADRLDHTVRDAGLSVVLVGTADQPGVDAATAVALDRLKELAEGQDADVPPASAGTGPGDPAYVIYTSGSTGRPKGVVVPHRNVSRLLDATEHDFGLGPDDTWSWFHSAAFDFSVWEIWGCLLTGGRLVVVPYWTCRSPEEFRELLLKERVTVLNQTPSAFSRLLELERAAHTPLAVRLVVFGGEPLDATGLTAWFDVHPEHECRVVNMFGITETTVHVTAQTVTRAEALTGARSVGRAIPGWSVRVLDGRGRLLPPGTPGEIAVAGDGVALHYLGRPELTDRRFVPDPDGEGRLYLSGDLGVLLPDGRLEHHGRLDDQVKVRGYRIELGEIRSVLLAHEAVVAAAVVLRTGGGARGGTEGGAAGGADDGDARLDAYVVLDGADPGEVRRHAAQLLPEYMMPGTLTAVDALPLTVNGKVDVARLPAPGECPSPPAATGSPAASGTPGSGDAPGEDAPRGALDEVLAVWREVFGPAVAPDDDFFHLGGNSLLALRIVRMLGARSLKAGVREVYQLRTPAALAEFAAAPATTS
ncbi:amino acid adenylation domain-containing protein [Streptomyces klenkii]|uniref:amino acid adenylation domain-containing protein n=1 Tax=Streptomyces klenkii TaxID=1420899 RepID=UPI00343E8724